MIAGRRRFASIWIRRGGVWRKGAILGTKRASPGPAAGEQQERLDGALEELPNWQARKLLLLVIVGAVLPRDAFVRQAIDRGGTSSAESLHLAQASLGETSFTFVAHERKGALVAGCSIR